MTKNQENRCSFCGKAAEEVAKLVSGPGVMICDECIELCNDILEDYETKDETAIPAIKAPKPSQIKAYLDQYVIGQEKAKKILSVAIYNHFQRIYDRKKDDVELQKSNILLLGPSGSGKTYLAQTLAKFLDVPFTIADCTVMTASGYVSADADSCIQNLYAASGYNVEQTEKGIVFLDECDKLRGSAESSTVNKDVGGVETQNELLRLVEGKNCEVPPRGGRKHPQQEMISIDTTNILFIAGGHAAGLEDIIRKRLGANTIGFSDKELRTKSGGSVLDSVTPEDLIKYGLIPELVGRFPVITHTEELSENDLLRIIKEPKNSLLKQYTKLLKYSNANLQFGEGVLEEIAKKARKSGTGARGLRTIFEDLLLDWMYICPDQESSDVFIGKLDEPEKKVENL